MHHAERVPESDSVRDEPTEVAVEQTAPAEVAVEQTAPAEAAVEQTAPAEAAVEQTAPAEVADAQGNVSPERSTKQTGITPVRPSADAILLQRWWIVLLGAVAIGAITFAVSKAVPATYTSSSEVVVLVSGTDVDATTLGANNLADQYAQVVDSTQVLSMAAKLLKPPSDIPSSAISGGAVAAQNLVSIQATAPSPQLARARAAAVADAFVNFVTQQVSSQATDYQQTTSAQLRPIGIEITKIQAQLNRSGAPATSAKSLELQQTLDTLLAERATAQASIAQTAVAGRPSVQLTSAAGLGSQTAPKPTLYALVGLIVGLLIVARLVVLTSARRATTWSNQNDLT
jgi:capsular polysaccharide biosynthesis protein